MTVTKQTGEGFDRGEAVLNLIDMIQYLHGRVGKTKLQLADKYCVGVRTIERRLALIGQMFNLIEVPDPEGSGAKAWRIKSLNLDALAAITPDQLQELDLAARRLEEEGQAPRARLLRRVRTLLEAANDARMHKIDPDLEGLAEREGLLLRPGPRPELRADHVETLRQAILAQCCVQFTYDSPESGKRLREVQPLGLAWGHRAYLVGRSAGTETPATWRLDRIDDLKLLPRGGPAWPDGLTLKGWMARGFGVWTRDEPVDIVLRFSAKAARDARQWRFHATQTFADAPDGSGRLIVRFRATGLREMAYHFATWEDAVEVLEPPELRAELARLAKVLTQQHAAPAPAEA